MEGIVNCDQIMAGNFRNVAGLVLVYFFFNL